MIGEWMLYAVAAASLAGAVALSAEVLLRGRGRASRGAWAVAMVGSVLLPAILPIVAAAPAVGGSFTATSISIAEVQLPESSVSAGIDRTGVLEAALLWGWLAASVAAAVALLAAAFSLRAARQGWRPARVAGARVLVSERTGPALVGVIRPEIVLPAWVLRWDGRRQRMIVAHETEHAIARDPLLLLAGWLLVVLMPWNPALWWQLRRLQLAMEIDCDRRVLRRIPDVGGYGSLLLEVGTRSSRRWLPAAAFSEPLSLLERRIRAMTNERPRVRRVHAALMVLAMVGLPLLVYASPAVTTPGLDGVVRELSTMREPTRGRAERAESIRPAGVQPSALDLGHAAEQSDEAEGISARLEVAGGVARSTRDTIPDGRGGFAYEVAVLERKPELINTAEVAGTMMKLYPPHLQDAGVGGAVTMQFIIESDGLVNPSSIRVVDSRPAQFAEPSSKVVEAFRFRPGRYQGRDVRVLIQIPLTWQPPRGAQVDRDAPVRRDLPSSAGAMHGQGIMVVSKAGASVDVQLPAEPSGKKGPTPEQVAAAIRTRHPDLQSEIGSRESTILVVGDRSGEVRQSFVVAGGIREAVAVQKSLGIGPEDVHLVTMVEGSRVSANGKLKQLIWVTLK